MASETCCILNIAPHYRAPIYLLMDKEIKCDFFIGNRIHTPIKKMDYNLLNGYKGILHYIPLFGQFYWQKGAIINLFRPYRNIILIGEPYCLSTWVILLLTKFTSKNTYLWTHGWYGNESTSKKVLKRIFFNLANKIFLYGEYAKKLMLKEGFKLDKLTCIYNSLDYDFHYSLRNQKLKSNVYINRFKNNYPVLIFVGRIQKVKKLDLLVQALEMLNGSNVACNLIVIGSMVDGYDINKIIDEKKLEDKIWLYGSCFNEIILAELIYNSTVCVSPGNVGLTAIHSLSFGTPVITHDNFCKQMPEFETIKPGFNGDYFKENDLNDLVLYINSWILKCEKNRNEIRKNCYEIIDEKYNPKYQVEVLKRVLQ